jgi:hypothetical protein
MLADKWENFEAELGAGLEKVSMHLNSYLPDSAEKCCYEKK